MSLPHYRPGSSSPGVPPSVMTPSSPQSLGHSAGSASFNILKERLRANAAAAASVGTGNASAPGSPGSSVARQDELKANPFVQTPYGNSAFNPQKLGAKMQPSHGTPKPPKAPEKPHVPFIRFSRKMWDSVKAQNPELKLWELGKLIGQMWRELGESEKQEFIDEYEADKQEYDRLSAQYKNSPAYSAYSAAKVRNAPVIEDVEAKSFRMSERRIDIQPAEDEEDGDEWLSVKHVAHSRFVRNHRLINEVFSDTLVPDVRSVVTKQRMQNLKRQVQQLTMHHTKLKAELNEIDNKFKAKKSKFIESSGKFQADLKEECEKTVTEEKFRAMVKEQMELLVKEREGQQEQQGGQQQDGQQGQQFLPPFYPSDNRHVLEPVEKENTEDNSSNSNEESKSQDSRMEIDSNLSKVEMTPRDVAKEDKEQGNPNVIGGTQGNNNEDIKISRSDDLKNLTPTAKSESPKIATGSTTTSSVITPVTSGNVSVVTTTTPTATGTAISTSNPTTTIATNVDVTKSTTVVTAAGGEDSTTATTVLFSAATGAPDNSVASTPCPTTVAVTASPNSAPSKSATVAPSDANTSLNTLPPASSTTSNGTPEVASVSLKTPNTSSTSSDVVDKAPKADASSAPESAATALSSIAPKNAPSVPTPSTTLEDNSAPITSATNVTPLAPSSNAGVVTPASSSSTLPTSAPSTTLSAPASNVTEAPTLATGPSSVTPSNTDTFQQTPAALQGPPAGPLAAGSGPANASLNVPPNGPPAINPAGIPPSTAPPGAPPAGGPHQGPVMSSMPYRGPPHTQSVPPSYPPQQQQQFYHGYYRGPPPPGGYYGGYPSAPHPQMEAYGPPQYGPPPPQGAVQHSATSATTAVGPPHPSLMMAPHPHHPHGYHPPPPSMGVAPPSLGPPGLPQQQQQVATGTSSDTATNAPNASMPPSQPPP